MSRFGKKDIEVVTPRSRGTIPAKKPNLDSDMSSSIGIWDNCISVYKRFPKIRGSELTDAILDTYSLKHTNADNAGVPFFKYDDGPAGNLGLYSNTGFF